MLSLRLEVSILKSIAEQMNYVSYGRIVVGIQNNNQKILNYIYIKFEFFKLIPPTSPNPHTQPSPRPEKVEDISQVEVDFIEVVFRKQFLQRGNMWRTKKALFGRFTLFI